MAATEILKAHWNESTRVCGFSVRTSSKQKREQLLKNLLKKKLLKLLKNHGKYFSKLFVEIRLTILILDTLLFCPNIRSWFSFNDSARHLAEYYLRSMIHCNCLFYVNILLLD